jgi:hypothetical protein
VKDFIDEHNHPMAQPDLGISDEKKASIVEM